MRISYELLLLLVFPSVIGFEWDKYRNAMLARKRLVTVAAKIIHGIETTVQALRHRSWMFDNTPHYEIGYVFSVCMERYRKMVEIARIARRTEWPIYHTIYLLDMQQKHFLEMYHTTSMLHEIPNKYKYLKQFKHVAVWQKNYAYVGSIRDFYGKGGRVSWTTTIKYTAEELNKIRKQKQKKVQNMKHFEEFELHLKEQRSRIPSYGHVGDRTPIAQDMVMADNERNIWKEAAARHKKKKDIYPKLEKLNTLPWSPTTTYITPWWCVKPYCTTTEGTPYVYSLGYAHYKGGNRVPGGHWDYGWEPDYEWWTLNTAVRFSTNFWLWDILG